MQPEELEEIMRTPLDASLNSGGSIGEDFRTLRLLKTQAIPGADEVLIRKSFRREIEEILKKNETKRGSSNRTPLRPVLRRPSDLRADRKTDASEPGEGSTN